MPTETQTTVYPVIQLPNNLEIQKAATTNELQILQVHENPIEKTVNVLVRISQNPYNHTWITVWEKESYDAIGQWTDTDLAAAVTTKVLEQFQQA
jgi:hypothetical protein